MELENAQQLDEQLRRKFVYVVGSARGGSWLVLETLGLSDEILTLPYMTHFANQVWRYRNKVHQRLLNQIFYMPCLDELQTLGGLEPDTANWIRAEINRSLASKKMPLMWRLYPLIHASGPNHHKRLDDIRCWADKANDVSYMKDIAKCFPEGKFVFVLRDPRASVLSLSKRSVKKSEGVNDPGWIAHLCSSCLYWRRMVQTMILFAKRHPSRCITVRFEELIEYPAATVNSIFSFIGVSEYPQDELLQRLKHVAYGASNNAEETDRGISKAPLNRWKHELSQKDQTIIAALTGSVASKAGYDVPKVTRAAALKSLMRLSGIKTKLLQMAKFGFLELHQRLIG